jgi:hypothetical protein
MEWVRKQVEVIEAMLRTDKKHDEAEGKEEDDDDEYDANPTKAPPAVLSEAQESQKKELLKATEEFDKQLEAVESRLVSRALRNSDDKYFIEPYGAYLDLIWLNAELGTGGGDVAGSADFAPRAAQLELLKSYEDEAQAAGSDFDKLLHEHLSQLNQALNRAQLAPVVVATAK